MTRRKLGHLIKALPNLMSGRADRTIQKTQASVRGLMETCGNIDVSTVTRKHLMTWRAERNSRLAVATVNSGLAALKSALSYAVDAEWAKNNVALRWRGMMITEPQRQLRIVELEEFEALCDAASLEMCVFMCLCFQLGLRRTEACNVRWSSIDFRASIVHVLNIGTELTKTRRNRDVPLRIRTKTVLWRLRQTVLALKQSIGGHVFINERGRAWQPDVIGRRFKKLVDGCGLAPATLHDLRRSFSTHAQRNGIDVATVMRLGGWSSVAVVGTHYTGDIHGHLSAAMAQLDSTEPFDRDAQQQRDIDAAAWPR